MVAIKYDVPTKFWCLRRHVAENTFLLGYATVSYPRRNESSLFATLCQPHFTIPYNLNLW
jgi:hypothetical protein